MNPFEIEEIQLKTLNFGKIEEFNENPFSEYTPVVIFSSGTEGQDWRSKNCKKCMKIGYCELRNVMLASLLEPYCIVPLYIAKRIGIDYNPLYQQGIVFDRCREYRNDNAPF